jgi:putative redox protein
MTSEIIYQGDLRTQATHLQSGDIILTDAPKDNHGKGEAFSPTDLVATALGSCMLSIMGIIANRHEINIVGTQVLKTWEKYLRL